MLRKKKGVAIVACMLMLILVLAACNNGSPAEPPAEQPAAPSGTQEPAEPPAATEDPVEITYWQQVRNAGESLPDFEALAVEFNKEHPNVTVKVDEVPSADIATTVETAIMGGTQPDVLRDTMMRIGKYANNDLLADVSDMYPDLKSEFVGAAVDVGTINGVVCGIPGDLAGYGSIINMDLVRAAGAEDLVPSDPERTWTREEYEALLKAVTKDGVTGTAYWAGNEQSDVDTKTLIEGGTGFSLFTDDFSKIRYDEPRAIEGVTWLKSIIDQGLAVKGAETLVDDDGWELFAQQKIAVLSTNVWAVAWIRDRAESGEIEPFEMRIVQYPNIEGETPKTPANVTVYSVFDKGDPDKVAWGKEWIKFVSESEAEKRCNLAQGTYSARLDRADMYSDDPEFGWVSSVLLNYGYNPGYAAPTYQDTRYILFPEMQAVFSEQKTPEQAMLDFTEQANKLIADLG